VGRKGREASLDSRDIQKVGEKPEDLKIFPYVSPDNLLMDAVKDGPGGEGEL